MSPSNQSKDEEGNRNFNCPERQVCEKNAQLTPHADWPLLLDSEELQVTTKAPFDSLEFCSITDQIHRLQQLLVWRNFLDWYTYKAHYHAVIFSPELRSLPQLDENSCASSYGDQSSKYGSYDNNDVSFVLIG